MRISFCRPSFFSMFAFSLSSYQAANIQNILDDIRKLKIIVKGHERRIKSLEDKVQFYEGQKNDSHI